MAALAARDAGPDRDGGGVSATTAAGFGEALRGWRRHRGLSQLALAVEAEVSPRHVSFLETGRSHPSQEMVLRLLDTLEVPLWDRNRVLATAGFAPIYGESSLDDENLEQVRRAMRMLLDRHEPYPAYAMDGVWDVVDVNRPFQTFLDTLDADPDVAGNLLRLLCAPEPLRPLIVNWEEVVTTVLHRVRRQLDAPQPPAALAAVAREIRGCPDVDALFRAAAMPARRDFFVPLAIRQGDATLRWMTTLVTIGGALDVTLDEMVIECFFPVDEETERLAHEMADG